MAFVLYNTLTKKLDVFKPRAANGKTVKMYTCGPTVYARPHIGNYRSYMTEDTLKRWLVYRGYRVKHVMNITDFDHTIIQQVHKTGVPREKMTAASEREFREDLKTLGAIPAEQYPHASKYANRMTKIALQLLKKGIAYRDAKGRIFFDISKYSGYGKLTGSRINNDRKVTLEEYKRFKAGDFLLWKPCRYGKHGCGDCIHTQLGMAEPEWNLQCATMSHVCLGEGIDIAMGGWDNRFSHHENTRAVVSALTGKEYAKYWMHLKHLIINGKKMSKRLGNIVRVPELIEYGMEPKAVRMMLLSVHYHHRLNFTWDYAKNAKKRFEKIEKEIAAIKKMHGDGVKSFGSTLAFAKNEFESAMDDDLNAAKAIVAVEKFVERCAELHLSKKQAREAIALLKKFDSVVACIPV
ncbi:MAG: class I tRNA ligase family protein [Candidatus Micrarchaeota archaeon]|nr:class I tRNA ligase family protein [Candidatus Micrarchaeota archaeon]